jgi:TolB-like protein/Tfp pilus assembly protein PilF
LTKLAKIADLKVISRTSVMGYRGRRNLRQIGNDLRVSHVLEGSVRRADTHLRLNAQLIDTRTDTHVWAQQYDRDLNDLFAIQSEIAQKVAERLNAKITSAERLAIEEKPTTDLTAFELYSRAKNLLTKVNRAAIGSGKADRLQAIDLLNQAVARDPSFFDAYCLLAWTHDDLYFFGFDHTPARLAAAEAAIQVAFRLRPDAGEAHLARAWNLYHGYFDYDGALAELEVARQTLPNNPEVFELTAYIQRRQGRWEESTRNLAHAIELDPRNVRPLGSIAENYIGLRRFAEAKSAWDRLLAVEPNDAATRAARASVELNSKADTQPLHQMVDSIRTTNPAQMPSIAGAWLFCALAERDADAAKNALIGSGENSLVLGSIDNIRFNRPFLEGVIARMTKDGDKAQAAFTAARAEQEKIVEAQPNYASALCALALIDAGLGRKDAALREGQRAVELLPPEKDAIDGSAMIKYLAVIAAWVGDKDLACAQLATAVRIPSGLTYGDLKLLPFWDPLRGDPRFEKLVEEVKQPVAAESLTESAPEKSIAVLPFENLSKDEENAFFAGGVQDEILTDLAKIADLKVISRTSVMKYKSDMERNLRDIANALGVSHVVEGSVQRAGDRVRVNVQLIDARNDTHLWAEHYDRDVADVFAVQTEIAERIADQLRAKLSVEEKAAIAERPTADAVAYAYYTKAKETDLSENWEGMEKSLNQKVELLEKALQRDPNFALACCELAKTHIDFSPVVGESEHRKHLELAMKAAETAVRLRPDLGEAHLELARYYFYAFDYDRTRDELMIVRSKLPNNAEALVIDAMIGRHENQWDASLANLRKASELDPRNGDIAFRLAAIYFEMRRYSELEQFLTRAGASGTFDKPLVWLARIKLAQGDPVAAQSLLEQVPLDYSPGPWIWDVRFTAALYLRDYDAADRVIAATPAKWVEIAFSDGTSDWAYGKVARVRGDKEKALAAFTVARKKLEAKLADKPNDPPYLSDAAKLDAGLGRKEDAIREAQRAVELEPIAKDAVNGPVRVTALALVYAWTGERDAALEQLEKVATIPGVLGGSVPTYGDLLLNPCWDDLRGDPRFDKIVAAAKAASK